MHAAGESRQIVRGLIPRDICSSYYRAKVFVVTWSYQSWIKLKVPISFDREGNSGNRYTHLGIADCLQITLALMMRGLNIKSTDFL
jgi:hypothetical protein